MLREVGVECGREMVLVDQDGDRERAELTGRDGSATRMPKRKFDALERIWSTRTY
ncbi:MAG TPA: hypothetical protein VMZ73_06205 [Acidimicrobiales bacterium]|nr:hypothetical protein [Acidimicrobiales bacterium]